MSAGKGSRPRPIINYNKYSANWDEISWDGPKCCNCNSRINKGHLKSHPDCYIIHTDGQIECKECNYN